MAFDKAKAIRAAEKHLAQGKVPAAIEEYKRICEHDPEDFSSLNTLGDLYIRTGHQTEAVASFKRVAEHYRVQGFALKAVAMYKKVSRLTPEDPAVAVALATLYEQQGLLVEARAQYLTVGDLLARRGNSREALEVLQRVADLDPNNTDIRLRLAEGFRREELPEQAAQAYNEAADRLAAKGDYERALDAYTRALHLLPHSLPALQGLLTGHAALGTADEAAEILEQAVAARPGDTELHAMLVRAYVEAEQPEQAERAAEELVKRDPTAYSYFFDVARLCLPRRETDRAVALLGRVAETALTGRDDGQLLEVLEEVLRRDPEHIGALQLLTRIYEWQRNDERLAATLERLAEAAEAAKSEDEERRALARLVRLGKEEARHRDRLAKLGGEPVTEGEEPDAYYPAGQDASDDVPTFESFMLSDETQPAPQADAPPAEAADASAFSWDAVAQTETQEAQEAPGEFSFADLNADFTDAAAAPTHVPEPGSPPPSFDFQEVDFVSAAPPADDSRERVLRQELESVDFYLTQGYTDIARDTLDMLERDHGAHPLIDERRARVPAQPQAATVAAAAEQPVPVEAAFDELDAAFAGVTAAAPAESNGAAALPQDVMQAIAAEPAPAAAGGIDPGLAAIFDEFREAVEDVEPEDEPDFETHYNLGLAYKDIEMYDQAVEAFQSAIQSVAPSDQTPRYLQCCNMLGHCFMRKGMPKLAAMWFRRGLDAPGHTEDEYQALRYELATAYEEMGDTRRAIDTFTEVYGIDVTYRGVADRLRELQQHETVTGDG
jgi:tetratricopeptide (TPR) repeat protein